MARKMTRVRQSVLAALALSFIGGCQTTSTATTVPAQKLSAEDNYFLSFGNSPDYITHGLAHLDKPNFKIEYNEDYPLKDAYKCGFMKTPKDGAISITFSDNGRYKVNPDFPDRNCEVNKMALLTARDDAISEMEKQITWFDKRQAALARDKQEKEAKRLAAAKIEAEKQEKLRLEQEAYKKSPKGQMDRYAMAVAELDVCADNGIIERVLAKNGGGNMVKELKSKIGSNYDKHYFATQYTERHNSFTNLVNMAGVTQDMMQACRMSAGFSNQKEVNLNDSRF